MAAGMAVIGMLAVGSVAALGARLRDPIPAVIAPSEITVGLEKVADGFVNPVGGYTAPGDKNSLYVVEERGLIWRVDLDDDGEGDALPSKELFADLSSIVIPLGCFGIHYDERGMFGVAFHPDYKKNGLVYTYSSETPLGKPVLPPNLCNTRFPDHDNVVREWRVSDPGDKDDAVFDTSSSRVVLRVPHPQFNHNGGEMRFGPDDKLYITIGDGGAADDQGPGHNATIGNAQDLSVLLGKILRIDPLARNAMPYTIPSDNPFVNTPGARPEIWAYGFRNPYKFSFDRKTQVLYLADVGQNDIEEVDIVVKGGNYGWRVKEGSFAFDPNGALPGFVTADSISGYIDPIAQYDHCLGPVADGPGACPRREGVSVTGGFVYRGHEVHDLRGMYVFGDYSRSFFTSDGRLFVTGAAGGTPSELQISGQASLGMSLLGIAEDSRGELYLIGKTGARPGNTGITDPANTSGAVYRIVDPGDDDD